MLSKSIYVVLVVNLAASMRSPSPSLMMRTSPFAVTIFTALLT
jgi:hypothetical protein